MRSSLIALVGAAALLGSAFTAQRALGAEPADTAGKGPTWRGVDPVLTEALRPDLARTHAAGRQIGRSGRVNVIVQLTARPVSAYERASFERTGEKLSIAERSEIARRIAAGQQQLKSHIAALGGRALASYRFALNGIRVSVPLDRINQLARLPGVKTVDPIPTYEPALTSANPYVSAPSAWTSTGRTGQGVTIAVIDTGIDYFHADFGGSGITADFDSDDPTDLAGSWPKGKVIGGHDFAGDNYDANGNFGSSTPAPDDDPLDCHGHGTHVAGIAAGFGVKKLSGVASTYTGAYTTTAFNNTNWVVAPGVAPRASIVAYKVFGCMGSTDLIVDAIDQAVVDNVDVINMSISSVFGRQDDAVATAVDGATDAGIVVVGAAGNHGPSAYIMGGVTTGDKGISVGAISALTRIPGALVDLASGTDQSGVNMNSSADFPLTAKLHRIGTASILQDGCQSQDYISANFVVGRIALIARGGCTFETKGAIAELRGAAAVVVVNDTTALPPYIGPDPDSFTIAMVGVRSGSRTALMGAHKVTTTLKKGTSLSNPDFGYPAWFTSGGPRNGDSATKPDISAPGYSVISAAMGTGKQGVGFNGTSMASPMVAGTAALVVEAHPTWTPLEVKAAIVGTAVVSKVKFRKNRYEPRLLGSGALNALRAADTLAFAQTEDPGGATLSFGFDEMAGASSEPLTFTLVNRGNVAITYNLSAAFIGGSLGATMALSPNPAVVPATGSLEVTATLNLSASAVATLPGPFTSEGIATGMPSAPTVVYQRINLIRGVVRAVPTQTGNHRYTLRIPFTSVPRGVSDVDVSNRGAYGAPSGGVTEFSATLTNNGSPTGNHATVAQIYAWGLTDPADHPWPGSDVRAVGVWQQACGPSQGCLTNDRRLLFAVNTYGSWSTLSAEEFDVLIDVPGGDNPDGVADFAVFNADYGWFFNGTPDGTQVVLTCSVDTDALCDGGSLHALLPDGQNLNSSTTVLATQAGWLGLSSAAGHFDYSLTSFNVVPTLYGDSDAVTLESSSELAWAPWNPWHPALVDDVASHSLGIGSATSHTFKVNLANAANEGSPLGWMVVAVDDVNGAPQADLIELGTLPAP